jgi:hypothetical protein
MPGVQGNCVRAMLLLLSASVNVPPVFEHCGTGGDVTGDYSTEESSATFPRMPTL